MEDRRYTIDDWAAVEADSPDVRYEYVHGLLVAMAGGTLRHAQIKHNIERRLGNALEGRCRVAGSDVRVETAGRNVYRLPDVVVYCGEPDVVEIPGVGEALRNPVLLVEVLSDATARTDLEHKVAEYLALETLAEYWIVDPDRPLVMRYLRDGRHLIYTSAEAVLHSEALAVELPLAAVYG